VLIHLAETPSIVCAERAGGSYLADTRATLEALLGRAWAQVVYASSALVYGDDAGHLRRPDELLGSGRDAYSCAKLAGEQRVTGAGGAVARLANLYGPGMASSSVVAQIVAQIPGHGPLRVRDTGPVRDFLWIEDAALALMMLAERHATGIFNVGTGQGTSVGEVAQQALAIAGESHRPVLATAPEARCSRRVLDVSATSATIGWRAEVTLAQGLAHLLRLGP
jgi:UDP-glucose 4-epimerase